MFYANFSIFFTLDEIFKENNVLYKIWFDFSHFFFSYRKRELLTLGRNDYESYKDYNYDCSRSRRESKNGEEKFDMEYVFDENRNRTEDKDNIDFEKEEEEEDEDFKSTTESEDREKS